MIIDDDEEDYMLMIDYISELGAEEYSYEWASNFDMGSKLMKEARHDIYLIDHWLGAGTGLDLIRDATLNGCRNPKILLTGVGNLELDMQAIKAGAYDYLPKTLLSTEMLERTLRHSIERFEQSILFENQQARFKNLFEQSIDPIYVTDATWNFLEANDSLMNLFRLKQEDLYSKTLQELFSQPDTFTDFITQILSEGFVVNFICTLRVENSNKDLICLLSSSPILDFQNRVTGYQGMIRDITQLKKAEKELMQAEQMNLTSRMARIIAHEVRNPLTNINLATDELEYHIKKLEDAVLYTDIIKRSSERINNLITDLLNSTRFGNPIMVTCAIEKVLQDVLILCNDRIHLKGIKLINVGLDGSTPLYVDVEKLKIAFINIITNAIEAMEQVKEPLLKIELDILDKEVRLKISDNGCGMDEHILKNLFEAFFTAKTGGMGLGMTTVQNIILQHHGTIQVESEVSKGTSFIIRLPRP